MSLSPLILLAYSLFWIQLSQLYAGFILYKYMSYFELSKVWDISSCHTKICSKIKLIAVIISVDCWDTVIAELAQRVLELEHFNPNYPLWKVSKPVGIWGVKGLEITEGETIEQERKHLRGKTVSKDCAVVTAVNLNRIKLGLFRFWSR